MPLEQYLEAVDVPARRRGMDVWSLGEQRYPILGAGSAGARAGLGGYVISNMNNMAAAPFNQRAICITGYTIHNSAGGDIATTEDLDYMLEASNEAASLATTDSDDRIANFHGLGSAVGTTATAASGAPGIVQLPFPLFVPARTRLRAGTASNDNSASTSQHALQYVAPEMLPKGTLVVDAAGHGHGQATTGGVRGYFSNRTSDLGELFTAGVGSYPAAALFANTPRSLDYYLVGIAAYPNGGLTATNVDWAQVRLSVGPSTDLRHIAEVRLYTITFNGVTGAAMLPPTFFSRPILVKAGGDGIRCSIASNAATGFVTSLIMVNAKDVVPIEAALGRWS